MLRSAISLLLAHALAIESAAGQARTDSTRRDTSRTLGAVRVEAARTPVPADRVPWAVSTLDATALRRGQATLGLDEAVSNLPGVVVSNRYNYALDQRLSIRGAGSRANFGLRGVKVLLDGIPQSLPDGQSQLTNVDLASIGRVEVLRGAASSLHGNGSGGVLAFTTDLAAPDRLGASVRATTGSFGMSKVQVRTSGRAGAFIGALSASRTTVDGFRQYSAADLRQFGAAVDQALSDRVTLSWRGGVAETPLALNPGALTAAEYALNPDTAALNNRRRGAQRAVSQRYLSVRAHRDEGPTTWSASLFGQRRFIDNPLATAPPAPAGATNGVRNTIDRRVTGVRLDASRAIDRAWDPRLSLGLDVQRSHDVRRNERTTGGLIVAPTDTTFLFQGETVVSVGPSAQLQLSPAKQIALSLGARWDRLSFRVEDHFTGDGDNDSGERVMTAASGHVGAVWLFKPAFSPYANVGTAFETPTTTELNSRQGGLGGFNDALGPQRIVSAEVGARGRVGARVTYEVAYFDSQASDAIVQYLESGGRAYFRNAGRTRSSGVELGFAAMLTPSLTVRGAYTGADHRFVEYRVPSATLPVPARDTLDGNRMAGIPANTWRVALQLAKYGVVVDVERTMQGASWGNDANTVRVADWGRGLLNLRASWRGSLLRRVVEPFVALQNALDERYIGAVTLNGFGGRVLEPAPGRNWYAGLEIGVPIVR